MNIIKSYKSCSDNLHQPKLRFKEFEGAWEVKKLEEIAYITTGSTPPTKESKYYNGNELFVSPADINENRFIYETKTKVSQLGISKGRKIKKGSVVFVCIGSTIGKVGQLKNDAITNQQINALNAKIGSDNGYIYSLLELKAKKIRLIAGVQAVPQINKTDFSRLKFSIPTLPEQQKIAAFLTAVDQKINLLNRKIEALQQYKKGVMQQIFSQKLRFKQKDGTDFPDWEVKKLGEVLEQQIREVPKPKTNYLAIGIRSHVKGTFQKPDSDPNKIAMKKLFVVKEHDLVVNITFAWEGAIAIVKKEDDGGLVSHRFPTYTFREYYMISEYFKQVILDKKFRFSLDLISPGGAGRNRVLSKKEFVKLKWTFPILPEQQKIASFLSSIDQKIEKVTQQHTQMQQFKKGLLQQMLV